jgi:hypothetical protein
MKKNNFVDKSENSFYFFDAFYTHYSFFAIFVNDNKTRFFTSLLDGLRFTTIINFSQNGLGIESCGIYSYVIDLVNRGNLSIDCVNLMFSEKVQAPLTNLVIRNKKDQKIDDVSKIFIFPADGSLISVLLKVPISIDDNSLKYLTLPVVPNIELPLLVDLVKRSIMLVEEKENKK